MLPWPPHHPPWPLYAGLAASNKRVQAPAAARRLPRASDSCHTATVHEFHLSLTAASLALKR